ncbi:MAG: efflux RND transporter periplasmic adaptor subunit [Sulfuritalea sp.]|nr:efflux RND transporter periplasmic adaptor subunit [Sulfuritalea sp.]
MKRWSALLLIVFLAACGEGENKAAGPSPAMTPGPAAAPPPAEVEVITVTPGSATITQDLPGRLMAYRTAQVRARVEGILERRLFVEGSDVKAGTALFRIDARTYRTALAAAEAEHAAAQAAFDRTEKLVNVQYMSRQNLDSAAARLKQTAAALARARLDLENAVPPAPISGRIGRALVTEGALVGRGEATHLATIEQIDPIRVEFTQSHADMQRLQQAIRAGQQKKADSAEVELVLDGGALYPMKGRLRFADLAVDPASGAVLLRAEFPNPHRELLPGAFVRVRFPQASVEAALRVPQRAVMSGPQGHSVLLVGPEDKVVARPVRIGAMAGADFIIGEGLAGGERVIVNGLQKARPGAVVKPVPWPPTARPAEKPAEKS